jgi:predicted DCC family thiol-disulfide oxidoreductase YuxK
MVFYIDGDCPFCRWSAKVFKRLLKLDEAKIVYSSVDPQMYQLMREKDSWILRTSSGELHFGFDAITVALAHSPLRWLRRMVPFLRLPLIQRIGQAFYELVTVSRPVLSKLVPA